MEEWNGYIHHSKEEFPGHSRPIQEGHLRIHKETGCHIQSNHPDLQRQQERIDCASERVAKHGGDPGKK